MHRILNHKKEARTSASESVAESGSHQGLTDQSTGEHLAASEIGAIADALEETFSSIFSGSFASVDSADTDGESTGLGGFVATPAANVFGGSEDEPAGQKPLPDIEGISGDVASSLEGEPMNGGAMAAPEPPAPAHVTAIGGPTFGGGPTVDAANTALEQLELTSPVSPSDAGAELEPVLDSPTVDPDNLDDVAAVRNTFEVSGVFVPDTAAAPAPPPEPSVPQEPKPEAAPVLTHHDEPENERNTSFAEAAAQAAAAKAEGEAAFDDMLASTSLPATSNVPATPDMGMPVPVPKPKGLLGKLIAWLKGLFGG
jgi:hypothetical protein